MGSELFWISTQRKEGGALRILLVTAHLWGQRGCVGDKDSCMPMCSERASAFSYDDVRMFDARI